MCLFLLLLQEISYYLKQQILPFMQAHNSVADESNVLCLSSSTLFLIKL